MSNGVYHFYGRRGHNIPVGDTLTGHAGPSSSATWSEPLDDMLGGCTGGAAFVVNLRVASTATDGVHNELRHLWAWDQFAFAMVEEPAP